MEDSLTNMINIEGKLLERSVPMIKIMLTRGFKTDLGNVLGFHACFQNARIIWVYVVASGGAKLDRFPNVNSLFISKAQRD